MIVVNRHIDLPAEKLRSYCGKWRIRELSLFGSVLTDEFRPDSDIDVLVVFEDEAAWDLWDRLDAEEELRQLLGRKVDLVEKQSLKNPFRRHHILQNREVVYEA